MAGLNSLFPAAANVRSPMVSDRVKVPNLVLRRIREEERQESRGEFADALAQAGRTLGESISPSERYVARLEDGDVGYPSPPYRRALTELCQRSIAELGFTPRYRMTGGPARDSRESALSYATLDRGPLVAAHGKLAFLTGAADSGFPASASPHDLVATSEWPVWFGIRIAHMISLVDSWGGSAVHFDSLQALLHQEVQMFDATAPESQHADGLLHAFSRRQALMTLAALPLTVAASGATLAGASGTGAATEFFLSRCAASLTACWHLLRGSDLPMVGQ